MCTSVALFSDNGASPSLIIMYFWNWFFFSYHVNIFESFPLVSVSCVYECFRSFSTYIFSYSCGCLHMFHLWFNCNSLLFPDCSHKRHRESRDQYLWPSENGLKETGICVEEWGGICEHLKLFSAVENEQASLNVICDGCWESLHRGRTVLAIINH